MEVQRPGAFDGRYLVNGDAPPLSQQESKPDKKIALMFNGAIAPSPGLNLLSLPADILRYIFDLSGNGRVIGQFVCKRLKELFWGVLQKQKESAKKRQSLATSKC